MVVMRGAGILLLRMGLLRITGRRMLSRIVTSTTLPGIRMLRTFTPMGSGWGIIRGRMMRIIVSTIHGSMGTLWVGLGLPTCGV